MARFTGCWHLLRVGAIQRPSLLRLVCMLCASKCCLYLGRGASYPAASFEISEGPSWARGVFALFFVFLAIRRHGTVSSCDSVRRAFVERIYFIHGKQCRRARGACQCDVSVWSLCLYDAPSQFSRMFRHSVQGPIARTGTRTFRLKLRCMLP